jgi:hypothetical protein
MITHPERLLIHTCTKGHRWEAEAWDRWAGVLQVGGERFCRRCLVGLLKAQVGVVTDEEEA